MNDYRLNKKEQRTAQRFLLVMIALIILDTSLIAMGLVFLGLVAFAVFLIVVLCAIIWGLRLLWRVN